MQYKLINLLMICLICGGCSTASTLHSRSNRYYPYTEMTNECRIYDRHGIKQQPVYSGSRAALSNIVMPWTCSGEECWGCFLYPIILPFSLIDISLSSIADTVALPYTYNLQFNECPNVNWSELAKKRDLLADRIRFYYSDCSNPEHVWKLSSSRLKGGRSKDEFIQYLHENDYISEYADGKYVTESMFVNKNGAKVLMYDDSKRYTILPWYDYWVYEHDNWYMDKPSRKTEYTLMIEKQRMQQ